MRYFIISEVVTVNRKHDMISFLYFSMLGLFLTHELDGVKRHEWRILPIVSRLPEQIAERVFIWAHVPLFGAIFYFGAGDPTSDMAKGMSVFAIIHAGLHLLYRKHKHNEFDNPGSWTLIIGTAVFGVCHLIAVRNLLV